MLPHTHAHEQTHEDVIKSSNNQISTRSHPLWVWDELRVDECNKNMEWTLSIQKWTSSTHFRSVVHFFGWKLDLSFWMLEIVRICTHDPFHCKQIQGLVFLQKREEKRCGDYMRLFTLLFKLNYYRNNIKHLRLVLALNKSFITYHQIHVNFLFLFLLFLSIQLAVGTFYHLIG